jgi:hypothetical protein
MNLKGIKPKDIHKKGSQVWADFLPMYKNGKLNPEFVKVYGMKRVKELQEAYKYMGSANQRKIDEAQALREDIKKSKQSTKVVFKKTLK